MKASNCWKVLKPVYQNRIAKAINGRCESRKNKQDTIRLKPKWDNREKNNLKNNIIIKENYAIVKCKDGTEFIIDREDIDKISNIEWRQKNNTIFGELKNKTVSLGKLLTKTSGNTKVIRKNKEGFDYRKNNLYSGNKYTDFGEYFEVECFDGKTFYIDKTDYGIVSKYRWHVDNQGYVLTKHNGRTFKLHRLLLNLLDSKAKIEVDHINNNPSDNRRHNLRLADRSLNCSNRRKFVTNKSGVVGVYWHASGKGWCAQVKANKQTYYLGIFNSITEAKNARDSKINEIKKGNAILK